MYQKRLEDSPSKSQVESDDVPFQRVLVSVQDPELLVHSSESFDRTFKNSLQELNVTVTVALGRNLYTFEPPSFIGG